MTTDGLVPAAPAKQGATPTALDDLIPGSQFGPYHITRLLGKGGMGAVYEAEHEADGRVVALKLLSVDLDKMDARERFLREGETAAAINHPNAVYIYGTEEIEGTPAITMELVPGGTLDEKVKDRGPLPWPEAVEDILQVIDGLDAALVAGVLHRDVKPSNCFVDNAGSIKIGDFGLSKPVDSEEQQKLTKTGLFLGTPVFSSPEQLLGESLDARSDIYAVGVTFYYLLTGQLPYHSGSMMQVVAAVLNGAPAPLTKYRADLPQSVIDVVMKSMARKADDRYQSYEEFRQAVADLRVAEVEAATIWDRARAGFVDYLIVAVFVWIASWLFLRHPGQSLDLNVRETAVQQVLISMAFALLLIGVPEGIKGFSLGKWIVGIRVIDAAGKPPGLLRGLCRVLVYGVVDYCALGARLIGANPGQQTSMIFLSELVSRGLLFSTARKTNGWRQLQDVLTGTRVVLPRAMTVQRRGEAHRVAAPQLSGNERRVGPYAVVGTLRDGSEILRGWDGAMKRAVWIVPRDAGSAEVSSARRSLSRLTRMRWVGGRRSVNDSWDAFEAPSGEPLASRLARPVDWRVQQDWLTDVANELIGAKNDKTTLPNATVDDLWVTPTDRIVFVETESLHDVSDETEQSIVGELIKRIQQSSKPGSPLPRHAERTLTAARAAKDPADVISLVRGTIGKPMTVTRKRRAGLIAATMGPMIVFAFAGWFTMRQSMQIDREGFVLAGLLSFVSDSARANRDSIIARAVAIDSSSSGSKRISAALVRLGVVDADVPDTITPIDTLRKQRKLAEAYIATVLKARANDSSVKSMFGNTPPELRHKKLILDRNTTVDSATARDARILVDSIWKRVVPGNGANTVLRVVPIFISLFFLIFGAFCSVVAGVFFRRGPIMRGFQVDVSTSTGAPAGRVRILLRTIVNWSVLLVPIVLLFVSPYLSITALAGIIAFGCVGSAVMWLVCIVWAIRSPARAFSERVSGTYLVPD